MAPPTIIDLKSAFLRAQILQLSQPLRPSASALSSVTESENALRQKAVDDALRKANSLLKKHNKLVYGPQATRHVAEQIDRLYWGNNEGEGSMGEVEEWCARGVDLREFEFLVFSYLHLRSLSTGKSWHIGNLGADDFV